MNLDPHSGIIKQAKQIPSANKDERPPGTEVDTLIIHAISLPPRIYGNQFVEDFFTNCLDCSQHTSFTEIENMHVSAHFYIKRNGELIQFVATVDRAWHAGASEFQGREKVNDFSIGVELEGCDEDEFESRQYDVLAELTLELLRAYPRLNIDRIVGHCDVAPGRKTDPGECFDWNRYFGLLTGGE